MRCSLEKPSKPLVELNLPPAVIACYHRLGISHLFAWQAECLQKASTRGEYDRQRDSRERIFFISGNRNFIFSAPGSLTFE